MTAINIGSSFGPRRWLRPILLVLATASALTLFVLSCDGGAFLAENPQYYWIPVFVFLCILLSILVGLYHVVVSAKDKPPGRLRDHAAFITMYVIFVVAMFVLLYFVGFWALVAVFLILPLERLEKAYLRRSTTLYDERPPAS